MKLVIKTIFIFLFFVINSGLTFDNIQYKINNNSSEEYDDESFEIINKRLEKRVNCLTLNILYEARGEGIEGMKAVAAVTMNRTKNKNFPNDVCKVVYQYKQFEWTEKKNLQYISKESKEWKIANKIAYDAIINEQYEDNTKGSLWFHSVKVNPDWAQSEEMIMTRVINNHVFYKANKVSKGN